MLISHKAATRCGSNFQVYRIQRSKDMHSRSPITRRVSLLLASLMIVVVNSIVQAQATSYKASFKQNSEPVAVNVLVGQSRVINFDRPVGRFSVSNPEIAEAVLVTPDQG